MLTTDLKTSIQHRFPARSFRSYFSPGRVNLIGEHTDYNGGHVLPGAIGRGTYFASRQNGSHDIIVHSDALGDRITIPLDSMECLVPEGNWGDYIKGSIFELSKRAVFDPIGLDIYIHGDLPRSSGLSSSASLTVGTLFLLDDMWNCGQDRLDMVRMAKAVENDFIGLQCGFMDPFTVAMGRSDHVICLDCSTLDHELITLDMENYEIVITDSSVPRKLSESPYNLRRMECQAAFHALRRDLDLEHLCAASPNDVEDCDALVSDPVAKRRALHVTSENQRVLESVRLLKNGDLPGFGKLMYDSHESLRDNFEVSCQELDILVDSARKIPGVLGSRMTGAGFGGCTVSIVASDAVTDFVAELSATYSAATPFKAKILSCRMGDGVNRIY